MNDEAVIVREEERGIAALVHLLGAIPLWGIVFDAGLWLYFKQRSREIVFHAHQAMMFQMLALGIFIFYLLVGLLAKLVGVLAPTLAGWLGIFNTFMLSVCLTGYAIVCIAGAAITWAGRPFLYPILGRRLLEGSRRKTTMEG